jgi:trehalose-6-phosphate synthase
MYLQPGASLTVHHVYALYTCADVLVATPLRDGMNTLPFE